MLTIATAGCGTGELLRCRAGICSCLIFLVCCCSPVSGSQPSEESIAVVVNARSSVTCLDQAQLAAIYSGTTTSVGGEKVSPYNQKASSRIRALFDSAVLQMGPEESARFWIDKRVRGQGYPPRQLPEGKLVVRLVRKLPSGLGYVYESEVDPAVRVVARVKGGKVVAP